MKLRSINLQNRFLKRVHFYLFISFVLCTTNGCKKGDKDPFLSLKSRKSRISNEWAISSFIINADRTNSNGIDDFDEFSLELDSVGYRSETNGILIADQNGTASVRNWTISRDGTWNRELTYTMYGTVQNETTSSIDSGTWQFIHKGGDAKNKERIVFNILSEHFNSTTTNISTSIVESNTFSDTYLSGENIETYSIVELRNSKTELTAEANQGTNNITPSGTFTQTTKAKTTYILE